MNKIFSGEQLRRPFAALVGVGVGVAALTACGAKVEYDKPATVVEHIDHPAYTSFMMAGKVPIFTHYPERFELLVRQCDRSGDGNADPNGCVTAGVDVTPETYQQYPDGSHIVFHEG